MIKMDSILNALSAKNGIEIVAKVSGMDGSGPRPVVLPAIHPVTLLRQVHGALILRLLLHPVTATRVVLLPRFIRFRNPHISRVFPIVFL